MVELTKDEINKKFIDMVKSDDSIERFMLCTPFATNDILKYGGDLTEDLFYKKLYVPIREDTQLQTEEEIVRYIKFHNTNTIYILGNKGCGKSTFVNKIRRTLKNDNDVCCEFIDFGESNSSLRHDKAKETLVRKIYKILKKLTKGENEILKNYVSFYYNNKEEIDADWDLNKAIDTFFKKLQSIINDEFKKIERLENEIRKDLLEAELFQLFFILTLLLIHTQLEKYKYLKPTAIVLDNLDNMLEITEIKIFIEHYRNYLEAIGTFINRCNLNSNSDHRYQVVYILVMREITKASISTPHSLEISRVSTKEYDVTELYSKKEISCIRTKYLLELTRQMQCKSEYSEKIQKNAIQTIRRQATDIQHIVNDSYIQKTIYPLFNNDYRIATITLVGMCSENSSFLKEYIRLMRCGIKGSKYGGRGIIYRLILNKFKELKYFKKIGIVNFEDRNNKKVSINRLILTYLNNTTDVKATGDSRAISLKEILKSFKDFKTKEIINCLWEMYNLIETEQWNPLITFVSSNDVSKDGLYKERKQYKESLNQDDILYSDEKYSFFRITCAGRIYLANICTHFEFFACRIYGSKMAPLFSREIFKIKNGEPLCKEIINSVFYEVELCCESLQEFESNNSPYSKISSNFNFKNESGVFQYHGERLIFSHISYIDTYRCYLLEKEKKQKKIDLEELSKFIIGVIENYINLFEIYKIGCSLKAKNGMYLKDVMKKKIKKAWLNPLDSNCTINLDSI